MCKHCNATIKAPDGTTTGMRTHLKSKHSIEFYKSENNDNESTLGNEMATGYNDNNSNQDNDMTPEDYDDSLTEEITKTSM